MTGCFSHRGVEIGCKRMGGIHNQADVMTLAEVLHLCCVHGAAYNYPVVQ